MGAKIAAKIWEMISSGRLLKAEELSGSEQTTTITLFLGVWGAGPATAQTWFSQGFRSLEDLTNKASLTRHQKVGLRLYEDLNQRIPSDEVAIIHQTVGTSNLIL